jgi:hypothetical protein
VENDGGEGGDTVNRLARNLRVFTAMSAVIGAGTAAMEWLGLFRRFDLVIFGSVPNTPVPVPADGLLAILLFAILPGMGIIAWRLQATIVCTILASVLYGGVVWAYFHYFGVSLPIVAPVLVGFASLGRGLGYNVKIDVEWAKRYGCFISYRRGQGAEMARLIAGDLAHRGIPAFLDVEDLAASHFDDQLLRCVESRPNFIVVLSAGALDRCHDPEDWLRKEVSCAIANRKNIIPVIGPGFVFPDSAGIPELLAELPRYQAVTYTHDFFPAMMDKLVGFLKDRAGVASPRRS